MTMQTARSSPAERECGHLRHSKNFNGEEAGESKWNRQEARQEGQALRGGRSEACSLSFGAPSRAGDTAESRTQRSVLSCQSEHTAMNIEKQASDPPQDEGCREDKEVRLQAGSITRAEPKRSLGVCLHKKNRNRKGHFKHEQKPSLLVAKLMNKDSINPEPIMTIRGPW